jgi:hypothetical protein
MKRGGGGMGRERETYTRNKYFIFLRMYSHYKISTHFKKLLL